MGQVHRSSSAVVSTRSSEHGVHLRRALAVAKGLHVLGKQPGRTPLNTVDGL